jgi:hypothetical protein
MNGKSPDLSDELHYWGDEFQGKPVISYFNRSAGKKEICLRILDLFKFMLNIAAP